MATDNSHGYLVQVVDGGRTYSPVAVFADQATANACVEELRGNKGSRVAIRWGDVSLEVAVPPHGEFEVFELSIVPGGLQPVTRVTG